MWSNHIRTANQITHSGSLVIGASLILAQLIQVLRLTEKLINGHLNDRGDASVV